MPQKDGTIDFCIVSALLWQSDVVEYHIFAYFSVLALQRKKW